MDGSPLCLNNFFAMSLPSLGIRQDRSPRNESAIYNCAEHGATRAALRMKANELLWLSQHLPRDASQGIDLPALQEIARERRSVCKGSNRRQTDGSWDR